MNGRDDHDLPLAQPLTPREEEILTCIGDGKTNRQIAEALTIAVSTVKWYVRQVYNKLGVSSRAAAVSRARSLGLLPQEEQEGAMRHNLPAAATPFVGRESELDTLAGLIADPQVRIITFVGPGGIGKTRLALEAAGCEVRPQSQFRDGVFFVSLAPLETADEIVSTLAAALDFHFQGAGSEKEQLLNYLRNKQMLLVMDNFEHILDGRALLAEVNDQAPDVTLLVTSRERLLLRGEQLFPLQGLEMPQSEGTSEEAVTGSPAAQLFLNIARRTLPDFQLLEGDALHLLRICRLVEGMPLGLELAASWAGLLPLSEIAAEIEQNLRLLASEHHDVPRRHRSMQAALDVSWERLTAEQKRAFQELTIFRGGFTRTAATQVAGATLPLLVTLVNKSWLSYDRHRDRYNIHELLRQYGASELRANPAYELEVQERHSAFFCAYLQEREADWFGPRQKEAAADVGTEIDNIQSAWRRAANEKNRALLTQGLNSLCRYYHWDGRLKDGQHACRLAEDGLSKPISGQQADDAQRLALLSQVLTWESEFVSEATQKEKLLAMSQDILDRAAQNGWDTRPEQAFVYLQKSRAAENKDYEAAIQLGTLGLCLFRELGSRQDEAAALKTMGVKHLFFGAFDKAHDLLRESLEISQQLQDTQGIAGTTIDLGLIAQHQGKYEEAETLHRQGLRLYKQLQNQYSETWGLITFSFTQSWAGKFLAARETAEAALILNRDLGNVPIPWNLVAISLATLHLGHYNRTMAKATESLEVARQTGGLAEDGLTSMFLGDIAFVKGDLDEARRYLLESASLLVEIGYVYQALPRANLCYVTRAQGEDTLARKYLQSALRSGIEYRSTTPIMYCLPVAALLTADDGRPQRAVELYGLAQQFGHIKNSRWFEDVACRELDEVRASLPADIAETAETQGRELDVWQTAEALLHELDGHGP